MKNTDQVKAGKEHPSSGSTESPLTALPTFDEMKRFLVQHYKHERLYGRNASNGWSGYGDAVVQSHLTDLMKHGEGFLSRHESASGKAARIHVVNGQLARKATA